VDVAQTIGIEVCGIGKNVKEAREPAVAINGAFKIAMLSRTSVFWPHLVPATEAKPGAATVRAYNSYQPGRRALEMPGAAPIIITWPDEAELEALIEDIRKAKKAADCVVLSMHWGVSSSTEIQDYQRTIAHAAIDAGASLIFGHHPHVVCPLEVYRGVPIFYSLGNFAFDWEKARNRILDGIVLEAEWNPDSTSVKQVTVTPVRRGEDNLIDELPDGAPEAIKTRDFLLDTARLSDSSILEISDNSVILTL
jgi:poly-gamma-glutamate synthesis protein (capsule biosynthesis protein)